MADKFTFLYKPEIKIYLDGIEPIIPARIGWITKKANFFNTFFPIYEASVETEAKNANVIFKNQFNAYCSLKITMNKYKVAENETAATEPVENEVILDHIFIPFFYKSSFSMLTSDEQNSPELPTDPLTSNYRTIKFALYSMDGLSGGKPMINAVLANGDSGVDVGTGLGFIIENTPFKECVIDKPHNETMYKYVIIPPHNLSMAILDLQLRYGVYATGVVCFFDPPYLYILDKYNTEHDYAEGENAKNIFNVHNNLGVGSLPSTIAELGGGDLEYDIFSIPEKENRDIYQTELYGNIVMYTSYGLTVNALKYTEGELDSFTKPVTMLTPDVTQKHVKTGDKIQFEYDELNNSYNMGAYTKAISPHLILSLKGIEFVNPNTFKPNSSIQLKYTDDVEKGEELDGIYNIMGYHLIYTRSSETSEEFNCKANDLVIIK
jgi:hypothetical protein